MSHFLEHVNPKEEWRPGVLTRMCISALNGAKALCVFEQWCRPGSGAPLHRHEVEEILLVLNGTMEIQVNGTLLVLQADESVIVPAGIVHGFQNAGNGELHVQAILAAAYFEAWSSPGGIQTIRWRPN